MEKYVIGIKRFGESTYQYAFVDEKPDNSFGVGFDDARVETVEFNTVFEAERWWSVMEKYLLATINKDCFYDRSSLCIQKKIVVIKTEIVKNLAV